MQEVLSNYWLGLLILGPLAGVFWGRVLDRRLKANNSLRDQSMVNQKTVVIGNKNTVIQNHNSNNQTVIHYHRDRSGTDTDPIATVLAIGGLMLFVSAILSWGFAKYGFEVTHFLFNLAIMVALAVLGFSSHVLLTRNLNGSKTISISVLLIVAGLNLCSAWLLRDNFRTDLADLANSYSNVLNFFFSLSTYGKTLVLTQAITCICLVMSVIALIWRSFNLNSSNSSIAPDLLALIPIFGALPFWLSNPNWSVTMIIHALN